MGSSEENKENKYHPGISSLRENHLLFSWYVLPATLELKEVNSAGQEMEASFSLHQVQVHMLCYII